jgi:hypothetical protein
MSGRGKSQKSLALIEAAGFCAIEPARVRAVCYPLCTEGLIPYMAKSISLQAPKYSEAAVEGGAS